MWEQDRNTIINHYNELFNKSNILLFGIIRNNLDKIKPIYPLVSFILDRIESTLELAINDKIWDSEIILRTVMESFVKLYYISTASKVEREIRINEYWNDLAEINSLKMSEQAKLNLRCFPDSEIHKIAYLPLIMPENLEENLREKWTRKKRQQIESRWSFTKIVNEISSEFKGTPLENILAFTHGYRMSSHVAHGDETGILIIEERNSRKEEDKSKAYRGHFLRIFSDCWVFASITGALCMAFLELKEEQKHFFYLIKEVDKINEIEAKYKNKVFENEYYNKYR